MMAAKRACEKEKAIQAAMNKKVSIAKAKTKEEVAKLKATEPGIREKAVTLAREKAARIETLAKKDEKENLRWPIRRILKEHYTVLTAMPSVCLAAKLALTFGASTAMCENSFSTLKNVFTDQRLRMTHNRKENLVQMAFEKDLTVKFRSEWKKAFIRKFADKHARRIQLF